MTRTIPNLVALLLLAVATRGIAAPPTAVFVDDLTWTELRDDIRAGKTTLIVPIGGTEQNGPHMALGKHNARVKALSEKIARALGNALVAPVVAYVPEGSVDPPTAHMRFPGTITVPDATFEKLLESAARSFKLHGFRDVGAATSVRAHAILEYYRATETVYVEALRSRGYSPEEIGTHAALADTSLTLALAPGMVRSEQLQSGAKLGRADGVYGDPRRSTAELGQLGVDAIVAQTVAAIRKAVSRN